MGWRPTPRKCERCCEMSHAICRRCNVAFNKRGPQLFCSPCKPFADKDRNQRWDAEHPESHLAASRRWRLAHPEQHLAAGAAWRAAHPEKLAQYRSTSKKRNPIANRSYVRVRKARQRNATIIPFTPEQLRLRLSMGGGRCWMCGGLGDTIDHVIPLSRGGAHALANLRTACLSCNSRKGSRLPEGTAS